MTPAERAVIDAARALEKSGGIPAYDALMAAVRALPRPLSEQLAELRPGAVVELGLGERTVLANFPEHECFVAAKAVGLTIYRYCSVTRIISNPEESNG